MEVVASLSQGRTAAQCGLFTHKSVPVIFEPPCTSTTHKALFPTATINFTEYDTVISVEFTHQQMHFFILKNTLKFTLKYTYISLLHVSVFDHHQGA